MGEESRERESRERKGDKEREGREKESEGSVVEHEDWGIGEDQIPTPHSAVPVGTSFTF